MPGHLRQIALLLAVGLSLWLVAATAAEAPVRVAADPDFAPIDGFDSRGRHRGLSADLLALLAARSGLRFEVQRYASLAEAEAALDGGRAELRASVLKPSTPIAGRRYSRPYLRVPAALIGRPGAGAPTTLAELKGRRIAVVEGRLWAALLRAQGHAEDLRPADDVAAALASVAEGRADAYVGDLISAEPVLRRLGRAGDLGVLGNSGLEAELVFAAGAGAAPLIAALDAALATVTVEEEAALQARWLQAGGSEAPVIEPVPDPLAPTISALRGTLPEDLPEREALLSTLDAAQVADAEADAALTRTEALAASIAAAEATLAAPEPPAAAAELLRWRSSLPQRARLEDLEQLLAVEQAARAALRETIQRGGSELDALRERPGALRRALAELEAPPAAVTASADRPAERVAALAAAAERRLRLARQALLLKEQAGAETLLRAAERQQREHQQELVQREERIAVLEQRIAEQGDSELQSLVTTLRAVQARHAPAAAPVRDAAAGNLATGERLLAQSRRLTELREQLLRLERQSAEVARALSNAQARIEIGGITATVGRLLMAERRKLPPATAIRAQQRALQAELVEVRLAQLAVGDEREALGSIGTAVRARLGGDHDLDPGTDPAQRAALTDLLLQRAELLPRLELQQQRVTEVLEAAERQLRQLATDGQALSRLIEQHLLWVPSHPPISTPWLAPLGAELVDLMKPVRWEGSGRRLLAALNEAPVWWALLALPLLLWSLWPAIDRALARRVTAWHGDAYTPTLTAFGLTLLRAAPMALLLALLGQLLQGAGEGGRFTHSLGRALSQLAPHVYLATLLIASCRPGGLAEAHLRWPLARRAALLRLRPWLYFGLLPLLLLVGLGEARDLEYPGGALLQLALVLASLALAAIGGWLLAPGRLLAGADDHPAHADPLPRLRRSLRVGLVGGGLLLAALPLAGYILTVGILLDTLLGTLWVLYAVLLGHGLVWRWLVLSERRLAAAQRAATPTATDDAGRLAEDEDSPDLQLVGAQSHGLLRASTAMLLAAGLLWSLAGVAPAFALLDTVTLWQTVSEVDGARVADVVTLGDLLLALGVLVFGVIAARNLPGLLELLLLQRFTGDASLRYAVVTVSRYLITFLLLVLVFGLLGVRWGHLQWLAAAFSVGLGFGLQEIFGNFVAGLILLFERPFRVGDVVTIGEYTGTVRRIRTRATTIIDFDNKDVVIPNKAFITDRFVNWTLSDSSTRITLKIGVDYHADPSVVRSLLLELAAAHPQVLRDPAPAAWFLEFGNNALHFELRCFVATIGDRLPVTDALYTTILDALRARGISIPYPQLEVHLKPPAKAGPAG